MTGTIYPRRRNNLKVSVGCTLLVIALVILCLGGIFIWQQSNCEDRGGHLEIIWGSGAIPSTVCDGAQEGLF